jgi:hypothetical protein
VHVVRLYTGDDVDLRQRTMIGVGAPVVRPGSPGAQIAAELLPAGAGGLDADRLLAGELQPMGTDEWAM